MIISGFSSNPSWRGSFLKGLLASVLIAAFLLCGACAKREIVKMEEPPATVHPAEAMPEPPATVHPAEAMPEPPPAGSAPDAQGQEEQRAREMARLEARERARYEAAARASMSQREKWSFGGFGRDADSREAERREAERRRAEQMERAQMERAQMERAETSAPAPTESAAPSPVLALPAEPLAPIEQEIESAQQAVAELSSGGQEALLAAACNRLATAYKRAGKYAKAEQSYRQGLAAVEQAIKARLAAMKLPSAPFELDEKGFDREETAREFVEVQPELKTSLPVEERQLPPDADILSSYKCLEAALRNNLAVLYRCWGRYQDADREYELSWRIVRERLGETSGEAAVLRSNLGLLYDVVGRPADAELSYGKSLAVLRKAPSAQSERLAAVTNNLAGLYLEQKRYPQAERLIRESLRLARARFGNNSLAAGLRLYNLGWLEAQRGQLEAGGRDLRRALVIATRLHDPTLLWSARSAYAKLLERQGKLDHAVYFAKQAVDTIQGLRGEAWQGEGNRDRAFRSTVEGVYRHLAALLIKSGRLAEADQALRLLKGREFASLGVRAGEGEAERVSFTQPEIAAAEKVETDLGQLAALSREIDQLERLRGSKKLADSDKKRLLKLRRSFEGVEARFQADLKQIRKSRRASFDSLKELETGFRNLFGSDSALLATVVGDDQLWVVLVTPNFRKAYRTKIAEADLNALVQRLRQHLVPVGSRLQDPRPAAQELYRLIFGATNPDDGSKLEAGLAALGVHKLVWTLDGVLRYLPVATLYDGKSYLLERYASFVYTPAGLAVRDGAPAAAAPRVLAAGVTKGGGGYTPLPGVSSELDAIVRDDAGHHGVLDGTVLLDEQFTWSTFQDALLDGYQVVHISSHFSFVPGDESSSHLLLGDLTPLSLRQLASTNSLFRGVELLTLSACETALGDTAGSDGREVEGIGVLAQKLGAQAVLATLWRVSDSGTSALMREFYQARQDGSLTRAEALRRAQLALLRGGSAAAAGDAASRGPVRLSSQAEAPGVPAFAPVAGAPYAHPYYWAPFVMMAGWQ